MNIPNIKIELTNQNKYNAVSLYPLVQEIYEKYTFEIQSEQTLDKLKNEIFTALNKYYPKIQMFEHIKFQTSNQEIKLYFTEQFLKEMEYYYPEALI